MSVKRANKSRLARVIAERTGVRVDPMAMFDVQVKRIHEYKRQLLQVPGVIDEYFREYFRVVEDGQPLLAPRVHFRGQGRAGLLHGQAGYPADQPGRRAHRVSGWLSANAGQSVEISRSSSEQRVRISALARLFPSKCFKPWIVETAVSALRFRRPKCSLDCGS
jgi:hypothetical protein